MENSSDALFPALFLVATFLTRCETTEPSFFRRYSRVFCIRLCHRRRCIPSGAGAFEQLPSTILETARCGHQSCASSPRGLEPHFLNRPAAAESNFAGHAASLAPC